MKRRVFTKQQITVIQIVILVLMFVLAFGSFVDAEESEPSGEACINVDKTPPPPLPVPQNLTATYDEATGDVTLTWDVDITIPFTGFRIYHGFNGGPKNNLTAEVAYVPGKTEYTYPWSETAPDGVVTILCFVATTYN